MNRTILIVGSNSGLGLALTEHFKDENVISFSRYDSHPFTSKHCHVDITNEYGIQFGLRTINELNWGPVTHLVVTAGIYGELAKFKDSSIALWENTINTNLIGPVAICKAIIPSMIEKRYGKIVLLSGGG